jgi:aspartate/methionine/tyrosine aminotransferase
MNRDLFNTRSHRSKAISDMVLNRPGVVDLAVGDPSWRPPAAVLRRLRQIGDEPDEAMRSGIHRYAPAQGTEKLRTAIAEYYWRTQGWAVDPSTEILVTHGAAQALWLSIFTLTDPGDKVLLPDPCYLLYEPIATALGRQPVRVPTRPEEGFAIDPDEVARRIDKHTVILMVSSPANPTGSMLDTTTLTRLVEICANAGMFLVHDEVLDRFAYAWPHRSAAAVAPEAGSVMMVNGFSKRFGMNGWRLGWLAGPARAVAAAAKAHTLMSLAANSLGQEICAAALNDPAVEVETARMVDEVADRGRRFRDTIVADGLFFCPPGLPQGSFYLFLDASGLSGRARAKFADHPTDEAVTRYLLQECEVAVVPGTSFGPSGDRYIRMSYATSEEKLAEAGHRLSRLDAGH